MKSQNSKGNKIAIIGLIVAALIFIAVATYAFTRSSSDNKSDSVTEIANHYPDLENVVIGKSLPSEIVMYEGFKLSFNNKNKVPNWVGWELLGSETYGDYSRSNNFWEDTNVKGCATLNDYRRSGYDRGHMCPAADQKWSEKAMNDCFVLTNMAPQDHALNSGAWKTLEDKERLWARRDSALIIVAGPIYTSNEFNTIGNGVRIPDAFFKVLLAPYLHEPRAIGFIYPNMSAPGNMLNYVVTVDEVERITGFDFFPNLPDSIEDQVEAVASFKEWNKMK